MIRTRCSRELSSVGTVNHSGRARAMAPFLRRAVAAPMQMSGRLVRTPLPWRQNGCGRQCVAALQLRGGGAPFSTDASKKSDPLESLPAVVRENCVGMGQVRAPIAPGFSTSHHR